MRRYSPVTKSNKVKGMIDKRQLEQMAKDTIKQRFGEEMDVELILLDKLEERKKELANLYDKEIGHDIGGAFIPAMNGHNPFLLVGYSEDDDFDLFEKYYHELQHAVDYFIVMKSIGKLPPYFSYYTEFNAGREGFIKVNMAMLSMMPIGAEQMQFISDVKSQIVKMLAKTPHTIFDQLCHVARVQAIAQIERKVDYSLYEGIPRPIVELAELIYRHEPTVEWYAKFKEMIESIPVLQ